MDSRIKKFLAENRLGVLSTLGKGGQPQSALIGYAECEDLSLIFGTDISSRKYENIIVNNAISFVTGLSGDITIQIDGKTFPIDKNSNWVEIHGRKHKSFEKYKYIETNLYFRIVPTWIRYSDFSTTPPTILEYYMPD